MDIFFQDPSEVPLPPQDTRIQSLRIEPYPDGQRVRVYIEVTPFLQRPNLDLLIQNPSGEEAAQANIIESMVRHIELTMHLRRSQPGKYTLTAALYYRDPIPEPQGSEPEPPVLPEARIVDKRQADFEIGAPST